MNSKSIIAGLGLLAAAYALGGCAKDDTEEQVVRPDGPMITVSFGGVKDDVQGTKTIIEGNKTDGFSVKWDQPSDKLGVYTYAPNVAASALTMNAPFSISSLSGDIATFTGQLRINNEGETTFYLYAYYPYTSGNDYTNSTYEKVACNVPAEQTMTAAGSFDARADYMLAKPGVRVTITPPNTYTANVDNFQFGHLMSFVNFGVKAITVGTVAGTETVESVKIEAVGLDKNPVLAGNFSLNLSNGETTWASDAVNTVTVKCPEGMTLDNLNAWLVVNPFTITADDELIVTVTTDKHIIEKTVSNKQLDFLQNNIAALNLTIDASCRITDYTPPAKTVWYMVSDASGVQAGDYIITYKIGNDWYYLPNTAVTTAPLAAAIDIDYANGSITSAVSDDMRWVATGNNTDGLTFASYANAADFLWGGTTNNGVRVGASSSVSGASKLWNFSDNTTVGEKIGLLGTATASASEPYYLAVYNKADWRNYRASSTTSHKGALFLFRGMPEGEVPEPLAAPVLTVTEKVVSWAAVPNASSYAYQIDNDPEATTTATSLDIAALKQPLPIDMDYSVKVKAVSDNPKYLDSPFSNTVTVTIPGTGTGTESYYVLVTALSDDMSGDYLIAYDAQTVMGNTLTNSKFQPADLSAQYATDMFLSDATSDLYKVTIAKTADGYTLKKADGYITYTSSTNFAALSETLTAKSYWDISLNGTTDYFRIINSSTLNASTKRAIVWRAGSQKVFGAYSTNNVDGTEYFYVHLYKLQK